MPGWDKQAAASTLPFATARVDWRRQARRIDVNVGLQEGRQVKVQIDLAELARRCNVGRDEIVAIADDATVLPTVPHPGLQADDQGAFTQMRLDALPTDCTGKTVLDIGGWDGEYAAACLARGATDAVVFDNEEWRDYTWARPIQRPGVRYARGDLMDFAHHPATAADLVLLYNVIYHIRDPWMALERCRLLTRDTFVICTSFVPGDEPSWKLFAPEDEDAPDGVINGRYTIYWRPTLPGLLKLLKVVGFHDPEVIGPVGDHVCVRCH